MLSADPEDQLPLALQREHEWEHVELGLLEFDAIELVRRLLVVGRIDGGCS